MGTADRSSRSPPALDAAVAGSKSASRHRNVGNARGPSKQSRVLVDAAGPLLPRWPVTIRTRVLRLLFAGSSRTRRAIGTSRLEFATRNPATEFLHEASGDHGP